MKPPSRNTLKATCFLTLACLCHTIDVRAIELPPHPRLLLNADGVTQLKSRVAELDWAKRWWGEQLREVDAGLTQPIELPPRGGNWYHWYVCPDDGTPLKIGKQLDTWLWEHACSLCGKTWSGGTPDNPSRDFDGCQIRQVHFDYANAVRGCGLAWQVTGDKRYLDRSRQILLAYAGKYLDYPLHKNHGGSGIGGGRVASQTLTEASWLVPIVQGADLIWADLSETDRETIANGLFLPAARDVILPHRLGIHNIQCWKNSAVGLVGFLLGDEKLISEAIDEPQRGYRAQMEQGVTPDGSWYEGAWGYHFYTLRGTWPLTEAARNCGVHLYGLPIQAMFDAPIRLMSPTGVLPAFNDSSQVSVSGQAWLYELAYARFQDPDYLPLLADHTRGEMAVLYGARELSRAADLPLQRSADYRDAGYAILTRGRGREATWLCLDYGPHGGGHGHPDKLGFVLFARGAELAVDPGTARYGTPLQRSWFRTTIAHNTLTVGESSQKSATGRCLAFGSDSDTDYLIADAGDATGGHSFTRGVALLDEDTVVFVDVVDGAEATTLDVAYHQRGAWGDLPAGDTWKPPEKPGYLHLTKATTRTTRDLARLHLAHPATPKCEIVVAGGPPLEIIAATGIGRGLGDPVPTVIFRRVAARSVLVWAISLDGRLQEITANQEGDEVVVAIRDADGTKRRLRWDLSPDSPGLKVE
jgi:hypothetical protein